jgi:dihydrofolate reductase
MTELVLIAALDRARAIGRDNALPWHLPEDLRRFKTLTLGKTVLMGRKTAQSLGRALPGRTNLVLTRGEHAPWPGMTVVASLDEAYARAGDTLYVIGGGEVYALALQRAQRMHLTWVDTEVDAPDAWFPTWPQAQWREVSRTVHGADARHAHGYAFVDYERA